MNPTKYLSFPIESLQLGLVLTWRLKECLGTATIGELCLKNRREVLTARGIGSGAFKKISQALEKLGLAIYDGDGPPLELGTKEWSDFWAERAVGK